jgi:hypothetical protein
MLGRYLPGGNHKNTYPSKNVQEVITLTRSRNVGMRKEPDEFLHWSPAVGVRETC